MSDEYIVCECQSEVLRLSKLSESGEDLMVGLVVYSTPGGFWPGIIWKRFKYAVRHLFTGYVGDDQMVLNKKSLENVWMWVGDLLKEEIPELYAQKIKERELAEQRADELRRLDMAETIEKVQISMRYDSLREKLNAPEKPTPPTTRSMNKSNNLGS